MSKCSAWVGYCPSCHGRVMQGQVLPGAVIHAHDRRLAFLRHEARIGGMLIMKGDVRQVAGEGESQYRLI